MESLTPLILIVDDEHANQFLLNGLLHAHGYRTLLASDGEECLNTLKSEIPDLILLDIMMPKITGIEVLKIIMQSNTLKRIPVLMVSAKTTSPDIREALEIGAIDYIKKPFDELELLARVKAGVRLKQKEEKLRELIRQREEFVKIISHDLRSPFTAIHGLAEILMDEKNLTPDQKESLEQIINSVEFSQNYFNKLLNWTKLTESDIELTTTHVNLAKLINSSILYHRNKASEKHIHLVNEVDPGLTIMADDIFFRQTIGNLISNAIKFTKKEGEVVCYSEENESGTDIVVSDNGIGMSESLKTEILSGKPIIHSGRGTFGERGTGLGLGICRKILDAHGYGFTCSANTKGGSDFIISIPG